MRLGASRSLWAINQPRTDVQSHFETVLGTHYPLIPRKLLAPIPFSAVLILCEVVERRRTTSKTSKVPEDFRPLRRQKCALCICLQLLLLYTQFSQLLLISRKVLAQGNRPATIHSPSSILRQTQRPLSQFETNI